MCTPGTFVALVSEHLMQKEHDIYLPMVFFLPETHILAQFFFSFLVMLSNILCNSDVSPGPKL